MEDQIYRTIEDSIKVVKDTWSKDLAEIRSMLRKLVGNLPMSKSGTVEFQRFCGENTELWISQAEHYFNFYEIAENNKLYLASSYLDGAALTWYRWLFQNKQLADWEHFAAKVLIRFHKLHLKSPEDRLANILRVLFGTKYPSLTKSPLPQNYDELSEYPTKIDEHKMFDEMLNSNSPKVFTVALDAPFEIFDEDVIGPDGSKVQLFYGHPQIDMSGSYVTTISLDCGSCKQEIGFEFFEDMYLAEYFLEPESTDDLYLDKFFIKNESGIPISELPSDEMTSKDQGQLNINRGLKRIFN
ncbi:uncharacterized protein LOC125823113 [Solanum verrucosum]|uniref:uncharacterized protein LOC125823113 n=1 Tax=Solanum verrucosum TaxID=315347 RepID=UPI0020D0991F|nr:uncharacterized protein LOC125823113 [Solanum verrucosum]